MKKYLILILFNPILVHASQWVPVKFGDLYSISKNNVLIAVTTYRLENGKQVSINHLQSKKNNSLFKCIENYSKTLQPTLGKCYVLEK